MYWQNVESKWSCSCCMLTFDTDEKHCISAAFTKQDRGEGWYDGGQGIGRQRTRADSRRNVLLKYSPVLFLSLVGGKWLLCVSCTHRWMDLCVLVSTSMSVCVCCLCVCPVEPKQAALFLGAELFYQLGKNNLVCILVVKRNRLCKQRASICLKVITSYASASKANQLTCYI